MGEVDQACVFFETSTIGLAIEVSVEDVHAVPHSPQTTLSRQYAGAAHAKGDSTAVQIEVQQQRLHAFVNLQNDLRLCCNRYTFEASLRFYLDGRRRQLRTARAVNGERVLGSSDEELTATIARVIFLCCNVL